MKLSYLQASQEMEFPFGKSTGIYSPSDLPAYLDAYLV